MANPEGEYHIDNQGSFEGNDEEEMCYHEEGCQCKPIDVIKLFVIVFWSGSSSRLLRESSSSSSSGRAGSSSCDAYHLCCVTGLLSLPLS